MKRRMIWILLAGILVGLALSGLYKHFDTDRIMDGGDGMENPDAAFLLDGDHTYADVDLETLNYLETYFDEQDAVEAARGSS